MLAISRGACSGRRGFRVVGGVLGVLEDCVQFGPGAASSFPRPAETPSPFQGANDARCSAPAAWTWLPADPWIVSRQPHWHSSPSAVTCLVACPQVQTAYLFCSPVQAVIALSLIGWRTSVEQTGKVEATVQSHQVFSIQRNENKHQINCPRPPFSYHSSPGPNLFPMDAMTDPTERPVYCSKNIMIPG